MAEAVHLGFKARYSGWLQINLGHMGIQPVMNFNAGQYYFSSSIRKIGNAGKREITSSWAPEYLSQY